jgi:hypothetical protein
MSGYVSVPEKTLEHWSSQYITHRFGTHAALWWPATGQDIDIRWLPARPGIAVQLELKTITVRGPDSHEVRVDLEQLENYLQLSPGRQPFYVFPWPSWCGRLEDDAASSGRSVTELAFSRSGRARWFARWMVAMTTHQVAEILDAELKRYKSTGLGKTQPLVQFKVTVSAKRKRQQTEATWGPGKKVIKPDPVIAWRDLWTELTQGGRPEWPQLIRLPVQMVEPGGSYSHKQLASLFKQSLTNPRGIQARKALFATLEPDDAGNLVVHVDAADLEEPSADQPEETASGMAGEGAEAHRAVAFLDAGKLALKG